MNDRVSAAARWLTALAVIFVPLSIIILISGSWLANFSANQWTRYLLFASWISLALSMILGVVNMISVPAESSARSGRTEGLGKEGEMEEEGGACGSAMETGSYPSPAAGRKAGEAFRMDQVLLLVQAGTFLLGMFLYVAFISWMVLPKITIPGY